MPTAPEMTPVVSTQFGERSLAADEAWHRGLVATSELGLTARLTPLPRDRPGAWRCELLRDDQPLAKGLGWGKGVAEVARVGALFEALEHVVSMGIEPPVADVELRGAHEIARQPVADDAVLALLAEGPDQPLACLPYHSLADDSTISVPVFLSTPDYHEDTSLRERLADRYDYGSVARYSMNNGWAAGIRTEDALVHALNETIERDAMSMLLIDQFLAARPSPLRMTDPPSLPDSLAALHHAAEERIGAPVWLVDMTTDLGVPAYWAYTPAPTGTPARLRGCGASLSRHYAIERALTELIQLQSIESALRPHSTKRDFTAAYPMLHRCYLADLTTCLNHAEIVPYQDAPAPASPAEHLAALVATLRDHGYPPYVHLRRVTNHLSVVHVFVPGLERFMMITDGQLVLPGARGRAVAHR